MKITENELDFLRRSIKTRLSRRRYLHTVSVESCAARLAEHLVPDSVNIVRAAALLHDITKELSLDEQLLLLNRDELTDEDFSSPDILHSFSAPYAVLRDFPDFADEKILSAVKNHTVGDGDMTLIDLIVFISDYAEETRRAESCQAVNKYLFDGFESLCDSEKRTRLYKACLMAISLTREYLCAGGKHVNSRMDKCEKFLLKQILQQ